MLNFETGDCEETGECFEELLKAGRKIRGAVG